MTDSKLREILEDMVKIFGSLPDPEHCPREFEHYVRLYKYYYYKP